jgi:hypothetical protein
MSKIWNCNDGTTDITGRGTPGKIPCVNNGGVLGSTPTPEPLIPIYNIGQEIVYMDMSTCPEGGAVPMECMIEVRGTITGMDDTSATPRYQVELLNGDIKYLMEAEISEFQPEGLETGIIISKTKTAGLGDNKMLIWLVVGGLALWYLNKEGYLKKILK